MRKGAMAQAIRNIITKGRREDLVIVIQSYSRSARLMELFYTQALKTLDVDRADVLILGWHNKPPSPRIMDRAMEMKEKGLYRFLGLSGHNRLLFPDLFRDERSDPFMCYNAAHRGGENIFSRMPERADRG
jgi:predicted aldo/keto reductase-like oxidoreductase